MSKVLSLYGRKIMLSEKFELYNSYRQRFDSAAENAANAFIKKYKSYGSLEQFVENGYEDGLKLISYIAEDLVIKSLNEGGIIDIDLETFIKRHYSDDHFCWQDAFGKVEQQYINIVANEQQKDEYRTMRRKTRDKWVGFGFGIGGAISASAKAGALNMASGAAHGLFNLGAKAISSIGSSIEKDNIYGSDETERILWRGIYFSLFYMHYDAWKLFDRHGLVPDGEVEFLKGGGPNISAIVNNMPSADPSKVLQMIPELILRSPYDSDLYIALFKKFGDPDGELGEVASIFGVTALERAKDKLIQNAYDKVKDKLDESEESATLAAREFSAEIANIGATELSKQLTSKIDKTLKDYDKKARSVGDMTFETREEAAAARVELSEITALISGLDYEHSETDALEAKRRLSGRAMTTPIGPNILQKVDTSLADHDELARSVICAGERVVFPSREQAASYRSQPSVQAIEAAYQRYRKDPAVARQIGDLLNDDTIPDLIKDKYRAHVHKLQEEKKELIKKITSSPFFAPHPMRMAAAFIVCSAIDIYCASTWGGMGWFEKIMAGIFVPGIGFPVAAYICSGFDPEFSSKFDTDKVDDLAMGEATLAFFCAWGTAALLVAFKWWDTWDWVGKKGISALLIGFTACTLIAIPVLRILVNRTRQYTGYNDLHTESQSIDEKQE